jgi:hypothetical protein
MGRIDQTVAATILRDNCDVHIAPRTLQKKRCTGGGPPFYRVGGRIAYDRDALLAWGRAQRSRLVTSTAELRKGRSAA